jgi:hypothetical protein
VATHELSHLEDRVMIVCNRLDRPRQLSSIAGNHGRPTKCDDIPSSPDSSIRPNGGMQIKSKTAKCLQELPGLTRFGGQTRAFLKVRDGSDGRCAYCTVPLARPYTADGFRRVAALVTTRLDRPAVTISCLASYLLALTSIGGECE